MIHNFTVRLDHAPSDDDFDVLYDAGLDDCLPVAGPGGHGQLMVAREADTLVDALLSVVSQLATAGFQAVGVESDDLVNQTAIGQRAGRTRASVSLLAAGKRGPGGFPAPVSEGPHPLYSWAAVREWFRSQYGDESAPGDRDSDTLVAADLLLRARLIAPNLRDLALLVAN